MKVLEGEPESRRVVVLEFPTLEAAEKFYHSAEYEAAREKRRGAAEMQLVLMEGYAE
jgi:uncharacterized protein (DUF1330 family)